MSKPFKVTVTRYVDPAGRRCPKHTPGARPVREESSNWYGEYADARGVRVRQSLCPDFQQSKKMLAKLIVEARLHSVGLGDRFAGAKEMPLADHLNAYAAHLAQKGNTPGHTADTTDKLR